MENILSEVIAQWGSFGILIAMAIWIIYSKINESIKGDKSVSSKSKDNKDGNALLTVLISNISNKLDKLDDRIDKLELDFTQRLNKVEFDLNNQPRLFINQMNEREENKINEHNKMMENQMKLGPELHKVLSEYKDKIGCDHIFLGSFHNGTTNISGIPYCKFDIIAEKFSPENINRDVELASIYKDIDILRHDKLPITILQEEQVYYIIDKDGNSELSQLDDIVYRRMLGRDIKQIAINMIRDENCIPAGFVGCIKYDYCSIALEQLKNCTRELELIYKNSK